MNKHTKRIARKPAGKIHYQSTGKRLTSQAGTIPTMRFLDRLGFHSLCEAQLKLQRCNNALYNLSDSVYLTVIGLIAGANSLLKVVTVWTDLVLREVAGFESVPDDSTLGRIFRLVGLKHVVQLENVTHQMRNRVRERAFKSGALRPGHFYHSWVDVDSTVKTVFGNQEGAAKGYNPGKKGALSYHPLIAFSSHTKEILQAWLRCGSAYTSNGIVEFMKQLAAQMPPKMRIVFRGDSGFFVGELMDWLDKCRHGYLIKVKLKGLSALLDKQDWQPISAHSGWEQCEFSHQCGKWKRPRLF